jgi:predicted porin
MNKKLSLAVAGAVMAFGASAANAGITIPAGDWTIDIGGNVNTYYTNTRWTDDLESSVNGVPTSESANQISTGLLPSALGVGGKTRQNDLDVAFQFTFFVGANSTSAGSGAFNGNGAGGNSLNIRQAFGSFGDASWGTVKFGRDLGIFGSDAILSDMTLLGVGIGAGGAGSSTLGRIGAGYLYADWVGQIQYASPNWNGFSFAVAVREPWGNNTNHDLGYDGKVSYDWAGDVSGKVWVGGIHQKVQAGTSTSTIDNTAQAWEIGGKVGVAGFGLVAYYYDGQNMGLPVMAGATELSGLFLINNGTKDHDVQGGYVQGTYTIAAANNLKLGVSWGENKYETNSTNIDGAGACIPACDDFTAEAWIAGAYYPLTKSVNLVAEYTDTKIENNGLVKNVDGHAKTFALGAIMFF